MAKKKRRPTPQKKSNTNLVYAGLALIILIALAVLLSSSSEQVAPAQMEESPGPGTGKYVKLNKPGTYEPGKVKITEYLKFNCEHCYQLSLLMPELEEKYGNDLEITYIPMLWRSNPSDLDFQKSIEAYILAKERGKGDEMKDALFKALFVDKKDLTSMIVLEEVGRSVGLDDDYVSALKNRNAKSKAEEYIDLSEEFQVYETPTIIINGNLQVAPSMTNGDVQQMKDNIDKIISSLLTGTSDLE